MLDSWYGNEKIMNTYRGKRVFGTYSGFWAIDSLASNERLDFQLLTCIENLPEWKQGDQEIINISILHWYLRRGGLGRFGGGSTVRQ